MLNHGVFHRVWIYWRTDEMLPDSCFSCIANFFQCETGILFTTVSTDLISAFIFYTGTEKRLSNAGSTNPGFISFKTAHQAYLRRGVQKAQLYQK
ncbi:hypothetical protein C3369_00725 [Escherichia sp. ESNIH1]|nr:hypothetical protein C3369_00725 [Escherichia sp. ESNIH1]